MKRIATYRSATIERALAALVVFIYLDNWNSLLWPLVVINQDELRTLVGGLTQSPDGSRHTISFDEEFGFLLVIILMIPVLFLLQRYIIQGITRSDLKG